MNKKTKKQAVAPPKVEVTKPPKSIQIELEHKAWPVRLIIEVGRKKS